MDINIYFKQVPHLLRSLTTITTPQKIQASVMYTAVSKIYSQSMRFVNEIGVRVYYTRWCIGSHITTA